MIIVWLPNLRCTINNSWPSWFSRHVYDRISEVWFKNHSLESNIFIESVDSVHKTTFWMISQTGYPVYRRGKLSVNNTDIIWVHFSHNHMNSKVHKYYGQLFWVSCTIICVNLTQRCFRFIPASFFLFYPSISLALHVVFLLVWDGFVTFHRTTKPLCLHFI